MKSRQITQHARTRMQQRAISELQVRLIQEFGQYAYQKGRAQFVYIPEKMLAELRHPVNKLVGMALVIGEEEKVITAMHQHQRITRTEYAA